MTGPASVPELAVRWLDSRPLGAGTWEVRWKVEGSPPVTMAGAPHGRFRAPERPVGPDGVLTLPVRCPDPENGEVENAFLIARAAPWRFLVRMRVGFAEGGRPVPTTEAVTVQRINFSGMEDR